tara:strand:+ start:6272 stop:6616 length:345 start_codon:yes stop_codon:yes gene_type:complete
MKNLDNQIAHIESLLQEILQKTNGESSGTVDRALRNDEVDHTFDNEEEESGECPFCGCAEDHVEGQSKTGGLLGPRPKKGKTIIMISKKGKKNGGDTQLPAVIKDIMGSLMKPE